MATYSNLNGTTSSSFKIGANGILLQSEAVSGGNFPGKYLLTNQTYDNRALRVAFEFADEDPSFSKFDSFIETSNIDSIDVENGVVIISLSDGSTVELSDFISGPASSTNNSIPLFDGTDGSRLKDSGKVIVTEVSTANVADIPTVGAVVNYVGSLSQALQQRLNGVL